MEENKKDRISHLENKYSLARFELISSCDPEELQLYLYLKLYAINKHEAFPGMKTIGAAFTPEWSKHKILRTIQRMEKKNRLIVKRDAGESNIYDITWYDSVNDNQYPNGTINSTQTALYNSTQTAPKRIKNLTIRKKTNILKKEQVLSENNISVIKNEKVGILEARKENIPPPVPLTPPKEIEGVNRAISLFRPINPSFARLYSNKTQRQALERLIKQHGIDKVQHMIAAAVGCFGKPFAPAIFTPYELEKKLPNLISYLQREKVEKEKNTIPTI